MLIGTRVFGRNTYPTDKPEPHGYEFFLTVGRNIEPDGDIDMRQGGLYAVLRFKNPETIGNAWEHLWNWIRDNKYEYIGMQKGENGWRNGFEERVNWHEGMPPNEWIFDIWVQLRVRYYFLCL